MIYIQLFFSFLQIGMFSFGGGYAAMPLLQEQVVNTHNWLTMSQFTDLITISQMTPGPIAINSATFVGLRIAGIGGAIVATIGCILPSCVLVSGLAYVYVKYKKIDIMEYILKTLRPAVVAMIATAGILILVSAFWGARTQININTTKWDEVIIFVLAFYLLKKKQMNPILVMVLAGITKVLVSIVLKFIM